MRVVSLNIWRGKLMDPLLEFLKREAPVTDFFCFQEMLAAASDSPSGVDVFGIFKKALPDFEGFFEAAQDRGDGTQAGLAIFAKRTDPIDREGDLFVYRTRNAAVGDDGRTIGRNIQFVQFQKSGTEYTIVNFHGLWSGDGRGDSDDRILQSKNLKSFLQGTAGRKIVCGDFNLTINTKSLSIIDDGMKNLIRDNGITSTRPGSFPYPDKYCDYTLVDNDITVKNFRVLPDEVSDHLAMVLDFE